MVVHQYTIANRRSKHNISLSDEALRNRVSRLRRQLKVEQKIAGAQQSTEEAQLENLDEELFRQFEDAMMAMQYEKAIDRLRRTVQHLEDETVNLLLQIIRIKGLNRMAPAELKTIRKNNSITGIALMWPYLLNQYGS